MIDITGCDKAEILAALYNNASPQGMGFLHYTPQTMTVEEARELLNACPQGRRYFDYLKGRVMKISLDKDELRTDLYDRDNGEGAAFRAIKHLLPAP